MEDQLPATDCFCKACVQSMVHRLTGNVEEFLDTTAHMRWRIERDYQDLKQDLGLGHHDTRDGLAGMNHHASLSIAAYGFLMAPRLKAGSDASGKKTSSNARYLLFPRITSLGEVQRAQRHVSNSIMTLRLQLGVALASVLGHCPHCNSINLRLYLRRSKIKSLWYWVGGRAVSLSTIPKNTEFIVVNKTFDTGRFAVLIKIAGAVDKACSGEIQRSVAKHPDSGQTSERSEQFVNRRILGGVDCLRTGSAIHVRDGPQICILDFLKVQHMRRWPLPIKMAAHLFLHTNRRNRTKFFTFLNVV